MSKYRLNLISEYRLNLISEYLNVDTGWCSRQHRHKRGNSRKEPGLMAGRFWLSRSFMPSPIQDMKPVGIKMENLFTRFICMDLNKSRSRLNFIFVVAMIE